MEQYFFIICIVSFAAIFGVAYYLIGQFYKELELYNLFANNGNMRALMAKDPKRFHISIVYLMTYMTRSDGDNVQKDKLKMIVRYICEVCPLEYQVDAIKALKYLTDRSKKSGKHTYSESLVNINAFMAGKEDCLLDGDNSYHYDHDLHGKRLAEELSLYMNDDDRLYVAYLLYRLAIADGIITTKGKKSEKSMLQRLCVKGLKIDQAELDNLINEFASGTDQRWYDQHFMDKDDRYPSSNLIANIFRVDINELASLDKTVSKTSVLQSTQTVLFISGAVLFVVYMLFGLYEGELMGDVYPSWILLVGMGVIVIMVLAICGIKVLESSLVPILRTRHENTLQRRGLILSGTLTLFLIFSLLFAASNFLFLVGNKVFSNDGNIVKTVPVTSTYITKTKSKSSTTTHYHVGFPEFSFEGKTIDEGTKKTVSIPNKISLYALQYLSGMKLKGIKNTRKMKSVEVNYSTYNDANNRDINLYFKMGYYGLLYYDNYELSNSSNVQNY